MNGMRCATVLFAAAVLAGTTGCASSRADTASPGPETLTPLIEQALPDVPGKTFTSAIVEFPPGTRATPHRHGDAFIYAYVLEGTVRSQVDDEPVRAYHRGENWVEQPGAHHVLTENTSPTAAARLLVVFVSNTGDELKVDDPLR